MALSTINATTGLTDGTVTSAKLADFAAAVDLNGVELVLDADADTSITADTDDRIDFKIANVEHFSFSNSSGDTVVKPMVDAKDIIFQQYDGNILLTIDDAGFVGIHNSAAGPGVIRIYEDTDLGSHYSGFTVGNLTASVSYVLPAADGSSGEQLTTNGSGVLSWATGGVSLANDANNRVVTGTGSGLNGEANLTFDGSALQLTGTLTVGVDDTGYDVKFFGATSGKSLLWDESADTLIVTGNATISGTATTTGVHTFTAIPLLPDNTVSTADIQADAITGAKIADDQIDSEHYVDGSIDTAHIADDAVTGAKIENNPTIGGNLTVSGDLLTTADVQIGGTATGNAIIKDKVGDQTAGNPQYTFTGNVGTGMRRAAGDIIAFDTGSVERLRIDAAGIVTLPTQSGFQAQTASEQSNLAIDAFVTLLFATEISDTNADYNAGTSTFTSPVTGKYLVTVALNFNALDFDASYFQTQIKTSNREYTKLNSGNQWDADPANLGFYQSMIVDMDASDTCIIRWFQGGGTAQADLRVESFFAMQLLA